MIDLHTHTNESDGQFTPEEQVEKALQAGLKALAITDHDTITGCSRAVEYAKNKNKSLSLEQQIEIIPGIEISCNEPDQSFIEIHVLGLFVDYNNPKLVQFSENIKQERIDQKRKMIQKLQEFGFEITFEEIVKTTSHSFGRPHVAKALMKKYPKKFPSVQSVFDQYLGNGKPAYFERKNYPKIKEAIELIKSAGGLAILAHPGVYDQKEVPRLLDYFRACGGQGLETHYSYHLINGLTPEESARRNKFFQEYAQKHSLVQSGGSDFHGEIRKTVKLGEGNLPYSIVVELKKNLKR